ncbi:MAG: L,D-transpeptidase family protein [Patescibacteria group bacterium]|nr:L,D-transpeptidase family protein [Patescibacteria group bacterium]
MTSKISPDKILLATVLVFASMAWATDASAQGLYPAGLSRNFFSRPEVSVWKTDFSGRIRFSAFPRTQTQGVHIAAGDLGQDGIEELVVGAGPGNKPEIKIFDASGNQILSFMAYPTNFRGGARVAVGDVDGDGQREIIVAPGEGYKSAIRFFDGTGQPKLKEFTAYDDTFLGGVFVRSADIDSDGKDEVLTAPEAGHEPRIRIWDAMTGKMESEFLPFDAARHDGVSFDVLKTSAGYGIAVAPASWSPGFVRFFSLSDLSRPTYEFTGFPGDSRNGLNVNAADYDGDGLDEIALSQNGSAAPELRFYSTQGSLLAKYMAYDPTFRGSIAAVSLKSREGHRIATAPMFPTVIGPMDKETAIEVNLTQQRLFAFEHGRLARSFLISSGVSKYPTPVMETSVQQKIPMMDYRGYYGPNNPDNYFIRNVKNNLRIRGPILIHYAFWHHNFGRRMSHGCINVGNADSDWIFDWAEVGTPVSVHY